MRPVQRLIFFCTVLIATVVFGCGAPFSAPVDRPSAGAAELAREIEALVAAFPGDAGVWISDPTAKQPIYSHNADEAVPLASLYKLGVLLEAERRVEARAVRYTDLITIGAEDVTEEGSVYEAGASVALDQALEAMITVSDNGTGLALWHMFGGDTIDATLVRSGVRGFRVTPDANGDTLATARGVGTFFELLARRALVSRAASERMIQRLGRQKINDRLPAELPGSVVVAHKTGNLVGLVHDAGIIFIGSGDRVVVVLTWDASEATANAFIAAIGALVYRQR